MVMALHHRRARLSLVFLLLPCRCWAWGMYLIMSRAHPIFRPRVQNLRLAQQRGAGKPARRARGEDPLCVRITKSRNSIRHFRDHLSGFHPCRKAAGLHEPADACSACTPARCWYSWLGAKTIIASGNNAAVGMTTGQLMSLITYAIQILSSLMMLSMVFVMITMSRASCAAHCGSAGRRERHRSPGKMP